MTDAEWLNKAVAFLLEDSPDAQVLLVRRVSALLSTDIVHWAVTRLSHDRDRHVLREHRLVAGLAEHSAMPWWRPKLAPFGFADEDDISREHETRDEALALYEAWVKQGRRDP